MNSPPSDGRGHRQFTSEPVVAVLMALNTLGTAWCSYHFRHLDQAEQPGDDRVLGESINFARKGQLALRPPK